MHFNLAGLRILVIFSLNLAGGVFLFAMPGEHGSGSERDAATVCPNQTRPPEMLPKGSRTPAHEPRRGWRQPHWEPSSPGAAAEGSASLPAFGFATSFGSAHGRQMLLNLMEHRQRKGRAASAPRPWGWGPPRGLCGLCPSTGTPRSLTLRCCRIPPKLIQHRCRR